MAYEFIKPGQKLYADCPECGEELEISLDIAKKQDKMTLVCSKCGKQTVINSRKILQDLEAQVKAMMHKNTSKKR